ncbi:MULTISPECIES: phosphotransferase family protein [unclassified Brachybacterium]|uniref:phosphotransferase family protein n=1 Tax=unclassified Brachybacterium TaxID=2623841 RepID=UPI004033BC09
MPAYPLTAARRDQICSALSQLADRPVRLTSEQHVGHDWAPVTRLGLDRDVPGIGATVVAKTRRVEGEGHGGPAFLRREAAALRTAAPSGVTARTIHVDDDAGVMLQTDLGDWPTLQDILLGADPEAAARGMVEMAAAVGRLHASTIDRRAEHQKHLAAFSADVETGQMYAFGREHWDEIEQACTELGLPPARRARDDVTRLLARSTRPGPSSALTHRDLNPTNVLLTDDGARLVDFEGSGFGHLGIDACFLYYPFPHHSTPWGLLPGGVIESVDAAYRTALADGGAHQVLDLFDQVLADGAAIVLIGRISRLRLVSRPDQAPQDSWRRRGQTVQQIRTFLQLAERADGLAAFRDWLSALQDAMIARWPDATDPPAPLFPAFAAERTLSR